MPCYMVMIMVFFYALVRVESTDQLLILTSIDSLKELARLKAYTAIRLRLKIKKASVNDKIVSLDLIPDMYF